MILDLERFQTQGRTRWSSLESLLAALEGRPNHGLKPVEAEQLQELYAQAAADLNRVTHGALAPELRQYLERLVARAYAELHFVDCLWPDFDAAAFAHALAEFARRQRRFGRIIESPPEIAEHA